MAKNLKEYMAEHSVDETAVQSHMNRMLAETRAYRLRELREEYGITQVQLAELLGVSQNRISQIEKGDLERSQIDTLRRYVEAVGGSLRIEVDLGDVRFRLA